VGASVARATSESLKGGYVLTAANSYQIKCIKYQQGLLLELVCVDCENAVSDLVGCVHDGSLDEDYFQ
jgi:hypothetical protein